MKTIKILLTIGFLIVLYRNVYSVFILEIAVINGNNISSNFSNFGMFNNKFCQSCPLGFEWYKNSGKSVFDGSGLCISAKINGNLAQATAFNNSDYRPSCIINGNGYTSPIFKIYKISRGDNAGNNQDYANWHLMIPYGAPYIDVNNNHQYDQGIDSIGIRNAVQVMFICMTDAFVEGRDPGSPNGFGGGITQYLLLAQVAWTVWCYDRSDLKDIQFMKWSVINKSSNQWNSTYVGIVGNPDLGNKNDDYIGFDISRQLGFCYNAVNYDSVYGANPPAVGMILHKSPKNLSSFTFFNNYDSGTLPCESGMIYPIQANRMMKGFKKDSSNYLNPLVNPPAPTKFVYPGDPETNSGWIESKGSVQNCGGNSGPIININPPGNRNFLFSSGADNYTVNPNDTITIIASQLIARGSSNLNSVTQLKNLANVAWQVYNGGFSIGIQPISSNVPTEFALFQNYPNPFNSTTSIKYQVESKRQIKLVVYNVLGKEITTLVNEIQSPGTYEVNFDGGNLTSGIYFYRLVTDVFSETKKMVLIK